MEKEELTKEKINELMKIKGQTVGAGFKSQAEYICHREGEEGLKKVEEKLKELGYPLILNQVNPIEWYPEALSVLVFIVAKEIFNLTEKDIFNWGRSEVKTSFVTKMLMKIVSLDEITKQAPNYWRQFLDFGELKIIKLDKKKKQGRIEIRGYKFHPIMDIYFQGFCTQFCKLFLGQEPKVEIIKSPHRGNSYLEFFVEWK